MDSPGSQDEDYKFVIGESSIFWRYRKIGLCELGLKSLDHGIHVRALLKEPDSGESSLHKSGFDFFIGIAAAP
jgi:hypothetical protein